MAFLKHAPEDFAAEALAGFAAVHADRVHRVRGGVMRSALPAQPEVAVVVGGGAGHYPAFGGLVGPGLAHGAVLGNIFASPSSQQVESVARAVDQGRGVLLSYGNYAGDVLQFEAAAERLRADGIDARCLAVTDDVFSAPRAERAKRRGIAGDLVVFKIAGAAAASGWDLDEVERVARRANDATRSIGVAFTGCTLPGASEPLFTVPEGRMAVGLGIHGEPGIDEVDLPTPAELARLLVERLRADAGDELAAGDPVVVVLNGLGAFPLEELYVLAGHVLGELREAELEVADIELGEFCTSFEMSGLSLTLTRLDDELAELWEAPVDAVAFRRGQATAGVPVDAPDLGAELGDAVPEASDDSRRVADIVARALEIVRDTIDAAADELGRIDAIAGDGDHGIGMKRGSAAAACASADASRCGAGAATTLRRAGAAWSDDAGGTSGALWGLMLAALGDELGDEHAVNGGMVRAGVAAADAAVRARGGAAVGDKTMVDAIVPFASVLASAPGALADAWAAAAEASAAAADGTTDLVPRLGRSRSHGERAIGVPDPGAVSFSLIVTALAPLIADAAELTASTQKEYA